MGYGGDAKLDGEKRKEPDKVSTRSSSGCTVSCTLVDADCKMRSSQYQAFSWAYLPSLSLRPSPDGVFQDQSIKTPGPSIILNGPALAGFSLLACPSISPVDEARGKSMLTQVVSVGES